MSLKLGTTNIAGIPTNLISTVNEKVNESDLTEIPLYEVPVIIDTYVDGTSGYRIWSDGYCEQWGRTENLSQTTTYTITFTKTFSNTNYNVYIGAGGMHNDDWMPSNGITPKIKSITTSSVTYRSGYTENRGLSCFWKASGYLASGQY